MSSIKVPFIDFAKEYEMYQYELDRAIKDVINRGDLILRQDVDEFEERLATWLGVRHVVTVANGTDALFLTLKSLGVGKGDEVITCSYTFRATLEAILHTGATPVLADIGEDWGQYKTANTKAIIPAHLEGNIVDWESYDIPLINDACQAIGADIPHGYASCYSFYPAKILGCLGDGGAVATNDTDLATWLKRMRNHDKSDWSLAGYNSRLDNLQAAVLNVRLNHLDQILSIRRSIAEMYDKGLAGVKTPAPREIYQDYIVEFKTTQEKDAMKEKLEKHGVQTMDNGYPFPAGYRKGPKAADYEAKSLRLPCNETMNYLQVEHVINSFNA